VTSRGVAIPSLPQIAAPVKSHLAALVVAVCVGAAPAVAQTPPGSAASSPSANTPAAGTPAASPTASPAAAAPSTLRAGGVSEAKPEVYFVKDKNGELVPLVGFTLEEFERMLRDDAAAAQPTQKPGHRFESIEATGTVDDRNARVQLVFTIAVEASGWTRVPLGLRGSVLEKQAQYVGSGKFTLEYDAAAGEYAAWFDGKADQTHKLTLRTATPLETAAGTSTLRLHLPRAWTSTLALKLPEKNVDVELSTAAVLDGVAPDGSGSLVRASGIGGDFSLSWSKTAANSQRMPTLLEANADIAATIDGHSIAYDAQLTVSSFGGEFDRFRIRLPASAVLLRNESLDVILQKLTPAKGAKNEMYEVRRIAGPAKSFVVRIQAVRPIEPSKGQATFDLGGIEVLEAVRQWGFLGVRVTGDWQVLYGERTQIRQVDALPEFFRGQDMAAVFEYFGRTFTLGTRILSRETRVTVDPAYTVDVTSRRAYLQARLGYRVGGAKVFTLDADFLDWQIDEVGPPDLVNVEAIGLGKTGTLSVPLQQPSTGEFTIVVRAHRDLVPDAKSLELKVPRPQAGVVGPATWSVTAAENVELSPREAASTGLLRQTRGENRSFTSEKAGWTYSTDAPDAKFIADYRILNRTVRVASATTVTLREAGDVVQHFTYNVAREPIDALEFDVASRLTDSDKLEVRSGDDVLPWVVVGENLEEPGKPLRIRVNLPQAAVGTFNVSATYPLALERPDSPASVSVPIALLKPVEGEITDNELKIAADGGVQVQHIDEAWQPILPRDGAASRSKSLGYRAAASVVEATLGIRWEEVQRTRPVHLERTWIQSVWLGSGRWERAVLRVTTAAGSAVVRLPPGATGIVGFVDGARLELDDKPSAGAVTVRFGSSAEATRVIDLRYQTTEPLAAGSLTTPTIEGTISSGQIYRQLVLPADLILWSTSPGYAGEYDWQRRGLVWLREPRMTQGALEHWCGAREEPPLPEQAAVYLVCGYGDVPPLAIGVVRRSVFLFVVAALVLAVALGLLYVPAVRSAGVVVAAAVLIGALGFAYPDVAPLAVQGALFGLVPVLIAAVIERNVSRRHGRVLRTGLDSASAAQRSSTRTRIVPTTGQVPPPSTAAIELGAPASASGGAT
jgi:hypothetical protein